MKKYLEERNADFAARLVEIALEYSRRGLCLTQRQIINLAIYSKPKRYYISYDNVARTLPRLQREGMFKRPREQPGHQPRDEWEEIDRKIEAYRRQHRGASFSKALIYLLNCQQPDRFYISYDKALKIFRETLTPSHLYLPKSQTPITDS